MHLTPDARVMAAAFLEDHGPEYVFSKDVFLAFLGAVFSKHVNFTLPPHALADYINAIADEITERRQVTHAGKSTPVPYRRSDDGDVIDAIDLALFLCQIDGWTRDPSPALWPQLQMTAHMRFIGLLVALRVGAPELRSLA